MTTASRANLAAAKAQADALGLRGQERHDFLADYIAPTPSNWHKRARAQAYAHASKHNYWSQCEALMPRAWRFFGRIFPSVRRRLADRVARLYKLNLAALEAEAYANRPGTRAHAEWLSLMRAKRKADAARAHKKLAPQTSSGGV